MKKFIKIIAGILILLISNLVTFIIATGGIVQVDEDRYTKVTKLEEYVKDNYLYDVTDEQLEKGELKGVVSGLGDPYSEYYTKEEYDKLMEFTSGTFYGIGVVITKGEDNLITVISPIKESPADKAGIKSGDKIIKINDQEFTADKMQDAANLMKGAKGTDVNVTILRSTTGETKDLVITRDEIQVETVSSQNIDNLGYISISQFDEKTGDEFDEAIDSLTAQNIEGLILDLRGNPGGVVDTAAHIADKLLPEGMIVYAENKNGKRDFEFKSDPAYFDKPLVVLIDGGSASASELLSGAIKDYGRAQLIGKTTFGKGIVQTANRFPNGDGIKLTTAEYFLPSGTSIHKIGVKPDIEIDLPADIKGIGPDYKDVDIQLQKAIEILNNK